MLLCFKLWIIKKYGILLFLISCVLIWCWLVWLRLMTIHLWFDCTKSLWWAYIWSIIKFYYFMSLWRLEDCAFSRFYACCLLSYDLLFVLCMLFLCMLLPYSFMEKFVDTISLLVIFAELARRERQKKMRRQNWVWGTIGSAAIVFGTTLLWSYLPNNEGSSLKNDFNVHKNWWSLWSNLALMNNSLIRFYNL